MATATEAARDEQAQALADMALEHEGMRDLAKLVTNETARREVEDAISDYDRRKGLLEAAKAANEALLADGHPNLDVREILDAAYKDIKTQQESVAAALAKFSSDAAQSLNPTIGQPVNK